MLLVLPDETTDADIVARLQAGDRDAVDAVYDAYFTPLYQFARLKVGDATLAEDIVSDVFVRLLKVIGTPSAPRKHLRGWLFQVTRNEIAQHYGKARQVTLTELEDWMPTPNENSPEDQAALSLELERVRKAMTALTEDHQEVLILRLGQKLSLRETADLMGKSISAIKSLQFRALDNLRNVLKEGASHA
jgi:RNA polymerase sigma-70 factor (ECF subfamily)